MKYVKQKHGMGEAKTDAIYSPSHDVYLHKICIYLRALLIKLINKWMPCKKSYTGREKATLQHAYSVARLMRHMITSST